MNLSKRLRLFGVQFKQDQKVGQFIHGDNLQYEWIIHLEYFY